MPHVVIAGKIHDDGLAVLQNAADVTIDYVDAASPDAYIPFTAKADAVLIRTQPMTESIVAHAPKLKIVSRHGVGYDAIDVAALNARGIALAIVGDVNSRAVGEHTLMLMLAAARRTVNYDQASRTGNWNIRNRFETLELDGKTLLLFGFGRIGRRVAQLAQAFGMQVMAHDPYVNRDAMSTAGVSLVDDLNDAFAAADFISLHVPLLGGKPVIGREELKRLKPNAVIVNAARGGLIDEAALDEALREGRIAGAALDVFAEEPPPSGNPLLRNERVTISPHSAGLTQECARRMAIASAQNILDYFDGKLDPALIVNAKQLSSKSHPA
ncbi:MAG: hydroxyacid dehydrogenase [Aestuariivirga sp.]